jgi:CHAD domain-containing protein/CYTH domain-containing protein
MPRVDNLRESTNRAVRLVALGHLVDASAARARLGTSDEEALHDFRVALRRLRSWERAFRPYLRDDVSKKLRRRLRDLARDTGASRDLEVHLAWLREQRRSLGRRQRAGLSWLLETLGRRKDEADAALYADVERRFKRLESRLSRQLGSYRERLRLRRNGQAAAQPTFAQALVPRVRAAAVELRKHLDRVHSLADVRDGHETRIAAKRLRYLLEPVMRAVPGAVAVVERLKVLQDVLGDLHDAQVFGEEIAQLAATAGARAATHATPAAEPNAPPRASHAADAAARSAAPPTTQSPESTDPPAPDASTSTPPPDAEPAVAPLGPALTPTPSSMRALPAAGNDLGPGIAAVSDRLRNRATAAFAQFTNEWLGDRAAEFFRELDAVADRIGAAAREGMEIERKYLLSCLPDEARDGRRLDIAQGYIPGAQLHERLRRVAIRHPSGRTEVHFYRTVKLGEGVARTEIEEETTEAIFLAMWPLTRRHRLRKRRFAVEVDGRTWEIDEFKNRDLVLAEIELESDDEDVTFPDWLGPAVQREVTDEPEFQNINLAR